MSSLCLSYTRKTYRNECADMQAHAIIFDRDNTLVRFDRTAITSLETRILELAPMLPAGAAVNHWTQWSGPWPRSEQAEHDFWRIFWSDLAARYALSNTITESLIAIGAFYHSCFIAFPDTLPCLTALHLGAIPMAVLTNFELPSIHLTLRHVNIDPDWFTALVSSAVIGIAKPDPRAYLTAAAALDMPPSACIFVDDHPSNVDAACAIGMRGLLLDRHHTADRGTRECIHNLEELPALFGL